MNKENYGLPTDVWKIIGQYLPKRSDYFIYNNGFIKKSEIAHVLMTDSSFTITLQSKEELKFYKDFNSGVELFEYIMLQN